MIVNYLSNIIFHSFKHSSSVQLRQGSDSISLLPQLTGPRARFCVCQCVMCRHAEVRAGPHPVGVSSEWSDHGHEERLLQQSNHGADHGLEACQCAKVVGRVAVGEITGD